MNLKSDRDTLTTCILATGRQKKLTVDRKENASDRYTIYYHDSTSKTATQKFGILVTADAEQNTDVTYGAVPLSLEIDGCQ